MEDVYLGDIRIDRFTDGKLLALFKLAGVDPDNEEEKWHEQENYRRPVYPEIIRDIGGALMYGIC